MKSLLLTSILCLTVTGHPLLHQEGDKISEISLEMAQGSIELGKPLGRAFKIIVRRDGTALYEGKANVKLIGKFRGQISQDAFNLLAQFLVSRNYSKIRDELPYRMSPAAGVERLTAYDSPVVTTSVVSDGKQKVVRRLTIVSSEYKKSIPKEIIEIENAITEAAMKLSWGKADQ